MKIHSNRDINKDHRKLTPPGLRKARSVAHDAPKIMKGTDKPVKDYLAAQHDNPKMVTEKHNDENLAVTFLIEGTVLIAYDFW